MSHIELLESRRLLSAGDLDPAFGDDGRVNVEAPQRLLSRESLVLDDGKILYSGFIATSLLAAQEQYFLRQLNADGTIDTSFGDDGTAIGNFTADPADDSRIEDIAVLSDGKILAVGTISDAGALARFNADGSLDTTFGGDGSVEILFAADRLELQPDGKCIVFKNLTGGFIARYNADGSLDTDFGDNGTAFPNVTGLRAVKAQPDGKLLLGGEGRDDNNDPVFAVGRLNADGTLDTAFGDDGKTLASIDSSTAGAESVYDFALLAGGQFLAAGTTASTSEGAGLAVVRFNSDGTVDPAYGSSGTTIPFGGVMSLKRVFADDDGNATLIGDTFIGFGAARLSATGVLDEDFGRVVSAGSMSAEFGNLNFPTGGIDPDGDIVIMGRQNRESPNGTISTQFALRLLGEDDGNPSAVSLNLVTEVLSVVGTSGDDLIFGTESIETVRGLRNGIGRVFDLSDVQRVSLAGAAGNDLIALSLENIVGAVSGGDGSDRITGGDKNDTLRGDAQRDFIDGGLGSDLITGNGGNDQLRGQGGADRVYGGAGNDYVEGSGGNDKLRGDEGTDVFHGNGGDDIFTADDGEIDQLFGDGGNDSATVDNDDVLQSIETI